MSESFFDALVTLVHKEIMAAKNSGDDERLAGVVTDLATTLRYTHLVPEHLRAVVEHRRGIEGQI